MHNRDDVPPKTVGVDLREEGVAVEYLDGRETLYRGVPRRVSEPVVVPPETAVHVLVTDPDETEGVMLYVNDLKTENEILNATGVGRVILASGDREELFPGVEVSCRPDERIAVEADPDVARGRVFVFAEDEWTDRRFEFVPADAAPEDGDRTANAAGAANADGTKKADEPTSADGRAADGDHTSDERDSEPTDDEPADESTEPADGWIEEPTLE